MSPAVYRPASSHSTSSESPDKSKDKDRPDFHLPKLRLEIRDLSHEGSPIFLNAIDVTKTFQTAVRNVLHHLYTSPSAASSPASSPTATGSPPPTRSVTLIVRPMPGVAYTTGTDLDSDHKEIHFSLSYISQISPSARHGPEITGVLTHELVHCYQFNAQGTCPGGLIEGIADWVRLQCGLNPPHWKKETKGQWDGGYQHTAYFLEYLEGRFGEGSVRRINEKLRRHKYQEKAFWTELFGGHVEQLWEDYKKHVDDEDNKSTEKQDESTTDDAAPALAS
ncbi:peptidase of plants and bacteria domain-containing protein [Sarocladium implicatum]|nr:peptidase of plants and bacteria domain-containing protein [Sarocladium implicatum]